MPRLNIILASLLSITASCGFADCFAWSGKPEVVGNLQFYATQDGQSAADVARKFDVGYDNLIQANPGVSPDLPVDQVLVPLPGTMFIIPTQYLIPKYKYSSGILINLPAKQLYYFNKSQAKVCVFPVGVGKKDWDTPTGKLYIMQKIKHPVWIVPKSIFEYRKKKGDPVPKVVQAGPDNPLGDYALRLSNPTYLMHGTNEPEGVGRRSSAGCIRMYPEDVARLFPMVRIKLPVVIAHMPINMQTINGKVTVQWHPPFSDPTADFNTVLAKTKTANAKAVLAEYQRASSTLPLGLPSVLVHAS